MEPSTPIPSTEATDFLQSLLNKNLRVTTTDSRMFWGNFKCTDSESNIILRHTYEYRPPPPPKPEELAAAKSVKLDMTSRFLGLVVVPGQHIFKIEVEEFASQMKKAPPQPEKGGGQTGALVEAPAGS